MKTVLSGDAIHFLKTMGTGYHDSEIRNRITHVHIFCVMCSMWCFNALNPRCKWLCINKAYRSAPFSDLVSVARFFDSFNFYLLICVRSAQCLSHVPTTDAAGVAAPIVQVHSTQLHPMHWPTTKEKIPPLTVSTQTVVYCYDVLRPQIQKLELELETAQHL
jgi:hypothetical protein